ncbi:MAG: hypothetical protein CL830_05340, partial [Crocinitomicaceae bacterium]|nr:hypothetical protein [Crocinitomicaceae bacterium]
MKKYFLLLSISLLSYANLHSQTAIDSALNNMNVDSIHDSTKLWKLYKATAPMTYENPDSTIKLLDIGLNKLESSNQLFESDSNKSISKNYFRGAYYNLIGICYYLLKRESECLDMWLKTEKICIKQNDTSFLLRINNNIAIVYSSTGRDKEALKIFTNNKKIYETKKDTGGIITSSINISTIIKNNDSIVLLLNNALDLAISADRSNSFTNIYANLAGTYLDTNSKKTFSLKKAKACLDSLILYANEQSDVESKILYYGTISEYYTLKNQYNLALKNAKKGAELSKQMTGLTAPELLSRLYEIHKKLKNYKKANFYLEQMVENKDSLEKLSAKEDITKYESEKEFEVKQQLDSLKHLDEIRIQQAETKAKEEEIKTQKIIESVLFVGILLVIGFLGFVYKQLNTTKKQKVVIEEKQQEISDSI